MFEIEAATDSALKSGDAAAPGSPRWRRLLVVTGLAATHGLACWAGMQLVARAQPAPLPVRTYTFDSSEEAFPRVRALQSNDVVRIEKALDDFDIRWQPGDA